MADSLGNDLHRLRAYAHPHVKHVITQALQHNDEADFGNLRQNESLVHLHRQAVKIQRGEPVDQITALMRNV
jgi:hypothetical protein